MQKGRPESWRFLLADLSDCGGVGFWKTRTLLSFIGLSDARSKPWKFKLCVFWGNSSFAEGP